MALVAGPPLRSIQSIGANGGGGALASLPWRRDAVTEGTEGLDITHQRGIGFHLEGFPDAVALLRVKTPDGAVASSLMLHRHDLELASACLEQINRTDEQTSRNALWRTAIAELFKCFQDSSARTRLRARDIYAAEPPLALEVFEFFKDLRNKHLLHDENLYAECVTGAVLNGRDQSVKIARVVSIGLVADTLDQANWSNVRTLVERALQWVKDEYERTCGRITSDLERRSYDDLLSLERVTVRRPGDAEAVSKKR